MSPSTLDLFAITAPGLETVAHAELCALGITPNAAERGGVSWTGTLDDVYAANLWLRTASRVIVRAASFRATSFFELERKAKRIPWGDYLSRGRPVRFRVTCRKSRLYHSDAVAQRLSESVLGFVGESTAVGAASSGDSSGESSGESSGGSSGGSGDTGDDDDSDDAQLFIVRIDHDVMTISADSSGALLHRRGYRLATAKAPLRETLAAAMLLGSGWDRRSPLIDPLCGSGTIAIEAALLARKMAPGRNRTFAFSAWPGFDQKRWHTRQQMAHEQEASRAPGIIRASDRDAGAVQAARENAERAGVTADVDIAQHAISDIAPIDVKQGGPGWIVTNPPYGVRVGDHSVRNLYAQLGKVMRIILPGWHLGLLSADPALDRQVGLPLGRVFETSNGGIPVRFVLGRAPGDVAAPGMVPAA